MGRSPNTSQKTEKLSPPAQGSGAGLPLIQNFPSLKLLQRSSSNIYPLHIFKRGKGSRLYDLDGNRILDFDLNGGQLLFGHAPPFITHAIKNAVSLGWLHNQLNRELIRFYSVLKQRFPAITEYAAYFLPEAKTAAALLQAAYPGWELIRPELFTDRLDTLRLEGIIHAAVSRGSPLLLDETGSAFRTAPELLSQKYRPEAAAASFGGVHLLMLPEGHSLIPDPFLPLLPVLAGASAFLKRLTGPAEPYTAIRALTALFAEKCSSQISAWAGFSPIIELLPEQRKKLFQKGFLLPQSGKIHFCSAHADHELKGLAAALNVINA